LEYTNVFSKTPHSVLNSVCQTAFKILRSHYLILLTVTLCAARNSISFPASFHREWFPCRNDFTPNTEIYIMRSSNLSHYILKLTWKTSVGSIKKLFKNLFTLSKNFEKNYTNTATIPWYLVEDTEELVNRATESTKFSRSFNMFADSV
jgi:hypothetical protein